VKAISKLDHVRDATGFIMHSAKLKFGRQTFDTSYVMGVNYNLQNVMSHKVVSGRFFSRLEEEQRRKYAVIGPAIAKDLFGGFSPIGEKIKINGVRYTVIGLLEEKGAIFGMDYDSVAYIPISAAESLFDTKKIMEIGITAVDEKKVPVVVAEIKKRLLELHKKEDFKVVSLTEMFNIMNTIMGALTGMIGGIAAISLLVGGIGIMNIMLVTVIERTREIGIRKSVGARDRDIMYQFLAESILISLVGGAIGMLFGVAVSLAVMQLIKVPSVIATWAAMLAIIVSVVVGIASGLYPSMRAARLSPIEALRYE
jgi:putative ABC transport system permease protein